MSKSGLGGPGQLTPLLGRMITTEGIALEAAFRYEAMGSSSGMQTTWKPHEKHGELTERGDLPDSVFAFPKERKEPLTDASHVRNAIARFDQTIGVSDEDRELAFANIKKPPSITTSP